MLKFIADVHLNLLLQQRRERLLHLKSGWTNPLASMVRFDCHVTSAVDTAQRLSGHTTHETPLVWTIPTTAVTATLDDSEVIASNIPEDLEVLDPLPATLDSDQTVLTDILTANPHDDVDLNDDSADPNEDTSGCSGVHASIVWTLPVCPFPHMVKHCTYNFQAALNVDTLFNFRTTHFVTAPEPSNAAQYLLGQNGLPTVHFEPKDINILTSPTARLNNVCMNSGSALLQSWFSSPTLPSSIPSAQCAILSTYDVVWVRYNATDEDLWCNIHKTSYWLRDIWILPIHRASPVEHWVLCVIYVRSHELFVFDSFAA